VNINVINRELVDIGAKTFVPQITAFEHNYYMGIYIPTVVHFFRGSEVSNFSNF